MVRTLAFYQRDPGSVLDVEATCGLRLLVLSLALRRFSPGTLVPPSPPNPTFPNSQFNQEWMTKNYEYVEVLLQKY